MYSTYAISVLCFFPCKFLNIWHSETCQLSCDITVGISHIRGIYIGWHGTLINTCFSVPQGTVLGWKKNENTNTNHKPWDFIWDQNELNQTCSLVTMVAWIMVVKGGGGGSWWATDNLDVEVWVVMPKMQASTPHKRYTWSIYSKLWQ